MSGTSINTNTQGIVADCFDRAEQYATEARSQVAGFLSSLDDAIYVPPTVSLTWNSIAPPTLPDIPAAPDMPAITVNMPTGAPDPLAIAAPTIDIDDFTESAPSISIGSAPVLSFGAAPTVPSITTPSMPTADAVVLPDTPDYLTLSVVSFGGVDLHEDWLDKLDTIPEFSVLAPTPYSYSVGPDYASTLLTTLQGTINTRLGGGTGLAPAVEQAIWDRSRDRETSTAQANIDEIQRGADALGFDLPAGVLAAQMRQAQQEYYDKVSTLSRDISIKQAELEQENLKQAINEGIALEGKLIDYSYQMERLTFENAKQYADNAIQVHNAQVEAYKALMSGYQMYAAAYDTIIKAELSKVEVYKAQLQAEQTKADVNKTLVEQYKAQVDAQMSKVEIYKAQVGAAQALIQIEATKINAAAEQIRAYTASINGETAKVEAFKAEVQAQQAIVGIYESKVKAYSSKVGAQAEEAKANLAWYSAMVQAKTAEWDGYKAKVQTESERVKALGIQSGAMLDGFKAEAAAIESEARMHTQVWETQIKDYEASQSVLLQTAKINNDAAIQTNNARLEAAKVGAQVYAQLTASAYSMAHATAGLSLQNSNGVHYNYSNDTDATANTAQFVL